MITKILLIIIIIFLLVLLINEKIDNQRIFELFETNKVEGNKFRKRNFASASAGAIVISSSPTWVEGYSSKYIGYITVSNEAPLPITALQPFEEAGQCWPMKGSSGSLKVQLAQKCFVSSFALEHIEPYINLSECIGEVPKNFSVYGIFDKKDGDERHFFGLYSYNNMGPKTQIFEVQHKINIPVWVVELVIGSNYGNPHYTCIYRFKVFGKMTPCFGPN